MHGLLFLMGNEEEEANVLGVHLIDTVELKNEGLNKETETIINVEVRKDSTIVGTLPETTPRFWCQRPHGLRLSVQGVCWNTSQWQTPLGSG